MPSPSHEVIEMLLQTKPKIHKSHKLVLVVASDYRVWLSHLTSDLCEVCSCLRPGEGVLFHLQS